MLIPPHGDLVTIRNLNTYVTFYELRSKSNESQHWDPFVLPIDTSRARYRGPDQDFRNNTYARPEGLWLPSSIKSSSESLFIFRDESASCPDNVMDVRAGTVGADDRSEGLVHQPLHWVEVWPLFVSIFNPSAGCSRMNEFLRLLRLMARSVAHEKHDHPRPASLGVLVRFERWSLNSPVSPFA
jgi:hypothetical protein